VHPYAIYLAASVFSLFAAWVLGSFVGVTAFALIAVHAQMQLLLSDYVQHYGLRRTLRTDGKALPMGPEHSWNAPQAYSAAMMMNAPRHSDHHLHPARTFPHLELKPEEMPTLPYSLPVMGAIALVPPLWRTVMDPRVRLWSAATKPVRQSTPSGLSTSVMSR
jgi:alkane 1-monooxygenase